VASLMEDLIVIIRQESDYYEELLGLSSKKNTDHCIRRFECSGRNHG